jgi:hypothetical protein
MNIDFPQGFSGEVDNIKQVLESNGFLATSENVFQIMKFKKHLLSKYSEGAKEKTTISQFSKILRKKEPIGSIVPIEYLFVGGLIGIVVFALARFTGSFADEAGKIAARKLFDKKETRKQLSKGFSLIEEDGELLETLKKRLRKKTRL